MYLCTYVHSSKLTSGLGLKLGLEALLLEDSSGPTMALSLSKRPPPRPPKIGASATGALGAGGVGGAAACPNPHVSVAYPNVFIQHFPTVSYYISPISPACSHPRLSCSTFSRAINAYLRGRRGRGSGRRLGQRKRSIVANAPVLLVCLQGVLLCPGAASHPRSRRKSSQRGGRRSRNRRGGRSRSLRSRR